MATLYELSEQGRRLYDLLESGEIDEQIFTDTLVSIGADEKIDTYCSIIRQLKADAEMYKAEKARLEAKQVSAENSIKRMKTALENFMAAVGKNKLKTTLWTVSVSPSSSVKIMDEKLIPDEFKIPQPDHIDKVALAKAIKINGDVPGAILEISTKVSIR